MKGQEKDDDGKQLMGFITKDPKSGTMEYMSVADVRRAFRGKPGGGSLYRNAITVSDSAYIVCHKPEPDPELLPETEKRREQAEEEYRKEKQEERRKKAEEEKRLKEEQERRLKEQEEKRLKEEKEKQEKIDSYFTALQNAFDKLTDIEGLRSFHANSIEGFMEKSEEDIDKMDKERKKLLNQNKAYTKARDDEQYSALMEEIKKDPRYTEITGKRTVWYEEFSKFNDKLGELSAQRYNGMADKLLADLGYEEVEKNVTEEVVDKYIEDWIEEAKQYIDGKTEVYDIEKKFTDYTEMFEKLYKVWTTFTGEGRKLKNGIRKMAYDRNAKYNKLKTVGQKMFDKKQYLSEAMFKICKGKPKYASLYTEPFTKHKNDLDVIVAKYKKIAEGKA